MISGMSFLEVLGVLAAIYAGIIAHIALYRERKLEKRLNRKEVRLDIQGSLFQLSDLKIGGVLPYTVTVRNTGGTLVQVTRVWINSVGRDNGVTIIEATKFEAIEHLPISLHPGESVQCYFELDDAIFDRFMEEGLFNAFMTDGSGDTVRTPHFFIDPRDPREAAIREEERRYSDPKSFLKIT